MKDKNSEILELEKRIRAERDEIDRLVEFYEISDDFSMRNKLRYLQAELDYVNSQFKILNELSKQDNSLRSVQAAKPETFTNEREESFSDTKINSLHFEVKTPSEEENIVKTDYKESAGVNDTSEKVSKDASSSLTAFEIAKDAVKNNGYDKAFEEKEEKHSLPLKVWERKEETSKEDKTDKGTVNTDIFDKAAEKESIIEDSAVSATVKTEETENIVKEIKPVGKTRVIETIHTAKREAVPVRTGNASGIAFVNERKAEAVETEETVTAKGTNESIALAETKKIIAVTETTERIAETEKTVALAETTESIAPTEKVDTIAATDTNADIPAAASINEEAESPASASVKDIEIPEEYEVEDTIEIKTTTAPVKKEEKKKTTIENRIGLMVMPILAATLIFIGLVLGASTLPEEVGNVVKQATMFVAGFTFIGVGLVLIKKKIGGAFGQVLMSIGAGELFVSVVLCRFLFNSISDLWLFIMLFIWSALLALLKRFGNTLVHVIGEIGVFVAVVFGVSYIIGNGTKNGIFVVAFFYLFSAFVYYVLFRLKGKIQNLVIFHVFNAVKILVVFFGFLLGIQNGTLVIGVGSVICSAVTCLSFLDLVIANRKDNSDKDIFCGIANVYYAIVAFATSFFGVMFLVINHFGMLNPASVQDVVYTYINNIDYRYIPLAVAGTIIFVMLLVTEFAWEKTIAGIFSEIMISLLLLGGFICSHETFKYGFIIAFAALTLIGYLRKNHILKVTALVFYVLYAFLPNEDIFRIVFGIGGAVMIIALLYTMKEQYLLAYKLSTYFSLILYTFMVSFSIFDTSSMIGARETTIISVLTVINLMMLFSPLSKDKEKQFDFVNIPEVANILVTQAALIVAFVIVKLDGTIGYLPLLIGTILTVVSLIRGFIQNRLLCKLNGIAAMVTGLVVLTAFDYAGFWFGALTIVLGLVLIYLKEEWYGYIYKLAFYLIALGYTVTCTGYFYTSFDNTLAFSPLNAVLLSMTIITLIFKFTPLSFSKKVKGDDFELTTFIVNSILAAAALITVFSVNGAGNTVKIIIFTVLSLIFTVDGFIRENKKEKIAAIAAMALLIFKADEFVPSVYLAIAAVLACLYIVLLYVFKKSYLSLFKYLVYALIIANCVVIPVLFTDMLSDIPYVHVEGIIATAVLLVTLIFKYTGLSKNALSGENDQWLWAFISECAEVLFATFLVFTFKEEGNYLPTVILAITGANWITHGFIKAKTYEKIAVIVQGYIMLCTCMGFVPSIYTVVALGLCAMFLLFMYNTEKSYSLVYKYLIYFLMAGNCIACPILFREYLYDIKYLEVVGVILLAEFVLMILFRFTPLAKNIEEDVRDFGICSLISEGTLMTFALIVMMYLGKEYNFVAVGVYAAITFIWMIYGFAKEKLAEKICTLAGIAILMLMSAMMYPVLYTVLTLSAIALYLFLLYRVEDAYMFILKVMLYALTLVNCIIIPSLYILDNPDLEYKWILNIIFAALAVSNTLFRFTPLCMNPETEERDLRVTTIVADNILILVGLLVTAIIDTPYDILAGIITLILVPVGSAWLWKDDEDGTVATVGKYIAVVEYVFVPFTLCYALSAPVYVSSIVAIVLSVGCVVLGFIKKMTGVRIYGLIVSMIMIFKLTLVDFEKTGLLQYSISFMIAGISCI
ncbi:MAG: hypothetical protein K5776_01945, partial [Lachnospiraceae bacterium]|nr:hypothetical protein [Lachnospiraceae bacterium]